MRKLIAGNWKMNGLSDSFDTLIDMINGLEELAGARAENDRPEALICPPFTLVQSFAVRCKGTVLTIGAQDCHSAPSGAHTGDISAQMLAVAGARYVILGHSERRADHGETDELVASKVEAVLAADLVPIICIGETLAQRDAGDTSKIVLGQLSASLPDSLVGKDFVIAYEPVWAIGTGLTPTEEQIGEVHRSIRTALSDRFGEQGRDIRILYGGSMKPANAESLLSISNVDGGLIGGASLKADDFLAIYKTAQ